MTATAELQQWALQAQDLSYAYPGTAPVFQHVSLGVRKREIVCLLGGGVPVKVGTEVIGAVGVGGAPGGHLDEQCAVAGIAKVQDLLK